MYCDSRVDFSRSNVRVPAYQSPLSRASIAGACFGLVAGLGVVQPPPVGFKSSRGPVKVAENGERELAGV